MKSYTRYPKLLAAISTTILMLNVTSNVLEANAVAVSFEPPPRSDAPRRGTSGGGSRPATIACGSAEAKTIAFTALSPGRQVGLSHSSHPRFFVYLPATTAQIAEFSLFDAKMNGIYQTTIPIANRVGLTSIMLPNAPALVKNQPYHWSLALACNPNDRTEDRVVGGWVEHDELSKRLLLKLAQSTPIEQITYYAKHGFWYDAIAKVVELQSQQPNNPLLTQTWAELLTSVGLENNKEWEVGSRKLGVIVLEVKN